MAKFLIVEARFYDHLNDMLVAGARAALKAAGHQVEVIVEACFNYQKFSH